jgi:hypothetical protein
MADEPEPEAYVDADDGGDDGGGEYKDDAEQHNDDSHDDGDDVGDDDDDDDDGGEDGMAATAGFDAAAFGDAFGDDDDGGGGNNNDGDDEHGGEDLGMPDDYDADVGGEGTMTMYGNEEEYELSDVDSDRDLADDMRDALNEREHLETVNVESQRLLLAHLATNKHKRQSQAESNVSAQNTDQVRQQYVKTLDILNGLWNKLNDRRHFSDQAIDRMTERLDRQDEKASLLSDEFKG